MRRSGVARVCRVAILGGQRRAGVRRRDGGQARIGQRLDAADGLVGAGRADEADDRACRTPASGRPSRRLRACTGRLPGSARCRGREACRPCRRPRSRHRASSPHQGSSRRPRGRPNMRYGSDPRPRPRSCRVRRTEPRPRRCRRRAARSAATPSAPTRMKRFKVFPPRDPIGPDTRPIMIECTVGPSQAQRPARHRIALRVPRTRSPPGSCSRCTGARQATDPLRAARRWPPKRCRIISVGEPNATPFGRAQAPLSSCCSPVLAVVALVG